MSKEAQARLLELMQDNPKEVYRAACDNMERELFTAVMEFTEGNQSHATRILGINRGTLRTKLARYNLI